MSTLEEARAAAQQGVWAAGAVAVFTGILAGYSAISGTQVMSIDAWNFVDVGLFVAIAFGIYLMWREAAVAGLVLYASLFVLYIVRSLYFLYRESQTTQSPSGLEPGLVLSFGLGLVLWTFLLLAFINAVRGTWAHHRLSLASQAGTQLPPPPRSEPQGPANEKRDPASEA